MKRLTIIRGVPGSGKSSLGKFLLSIPGHVHFENDMYLYNTEDTYVWTKERAHIAYNKCLTNVREQMSLGAFSISVGNMFTRERDIKVYSDLAKEYGYIFTSIVVENRHGGLDTKGCSDEQETKK